MRSYRIPSIPIGRAVRSGENKKKAGPKTSLESF